jgi:hypothetical protein
VPAHFFGGWPTSGAGRSQAMQARERLDLRFDKKILTLVFPWRRLGCA